MGFCSDFNFGMYATVRGIRTVGYAYTRHLDSNIHDKKEHVYKNWEIFYEGDKIITCNYLIDDRSFWRIVNF